MPWKPSEAPRHDKKATGKAGRQWSEVANSVLKRTGDEGLAIREASGVVKNNFKSESHSYDSNRPKRQVVSRYK
jgi:hypothetical protein